MAKLTKLEIKQHEIAMALLQKPELTEDEIDLVYQNYQEGAENINSKYGAFFTPLSLALDFALHIPAAYQRCTKIIDLCSGIGVLSYAAICRAQYNHAVEIVCVELNDKYIDIGKKLVPQATWIQGDALDPMFLASLGHFDCAISNPPFGSIKTAHKYRGTCFEHKIIEAASMIADYGAFIVPQMSAPFRYSGARYHQWLDSGRGRDFEKATGIELGFGIGVDTSFFKDDWHGVSPVCEIGCCDFKG